MVRPLMAGAASPVEPEPDRRRHPERALSAHPGPRQQLERTHYPDQALDSQAQGYECPYPQLAALVRLATQLAYPIPQPGAQYVALVALAAWLAEQTWQAQYAASVALAT